MIQSVMIDGYVAADPSCLTSPSGDRRASFRLLETATFKRADGERTERTTGFNCICFSDAVVRNYIELYMRKGSRVLLLGHVENNSWKDRDGGEHYDLRVVVKDVTIQNKRDDEDTHDPETGEVFEGQSTAGAVQDLDDETPF